MAATDSLESSPPQNAALGSSVWSFLADHWLIKDSWLREESWGSRLRRYPLLWAAILLIVGGKCGELAAASPIADQLLVGAMVLTIVLAGVAYFLDAVKFSVTLIAVASLVFAGYWHGWNSVPFGSDALSEVATRKSEPIVLRGVIATAPVWRPNPNFRKNDPDSEAWKTQWEIEVTSVRSGFAWEPVQFLSTLGVEGRVGSLLPGDEIEVFGAIRRINPPTNPGAFDFRRHSMREGKYTQLSAESEKQIEKIGEKTTHRFRRWRAYAVRYVDEAFRKWVTQGQAPLAAALVFGQREQVDWQDQQELMATGTLHMLAISGMHVEIVAWGVIALCVLSQVGDKMRLLILVLVCCLYAILADGKPPVIRAVVLVGAIELARCFGRRSRLSNLLSLAAIVLFLMRYSHLENVGVHLSFLAVATIGIFVLDLSDSLRRKQEQASELALQKVVRESFGPLARWADLAWSWFLNMLRLSFWVWLITCPLIWTNFHVVAPVAVLLNIVIAVPLAVSLLAGIGTAVLSWLPPAASILGAVTGAGLSLIQACIGVGKTLPGSHLWLPAPPLWWTYAFYGLAVGWLLVFGSKYRDKLGWSLTLWLIFGLGWFAAGPKGWLNDSHAISLGQTALPDVENQSLNVTFLDVGHGTSVIVELPDGRVWLYDAGHLGASDRSHQAIADALWEIGTARIDTLLISHADADHYNATEGLVERFAVNRVISTAAFWDSQDRNVQELVETLALHGIEMGEWAAGDHGTEAGVVWSVLHPAADHRAESDNAASLCILLEYEGKRVLLPGDLEGSGLYGLTQLPSRPCHVLMAPHHGSLTLDPSELLQWCQPECIVVSGNHKANREPVIRKYSRPDCWLGITFRDGAIQYRVDAGGASIWNWGDGWQPVELGE